MQDKLLSNVKHCKRGMVNNPICIICGNGQKTVILGIENCHIAQFFWNKIVPQRHQSSIAWARHIFCQGLQDKIPRPTAFCIFVILGLQYFDAQVVGMSTIMQVKVWEIYDGLDMVDGAS